jgi:hypothetical protein
MKSRKRAAISSTKKHRHLRGKELHQTERLLAILMLLLQHNIDKLLHHHRSN